MGLSQYYVHGRKVSRLTWVDSSLFYFILVLPLNIKLFDNWILYFYLVCFRLGYSNITIKSQIWHVNFDGLESSFFLNFFIIIILFIFIAFFIYII